MTIKQLCTWADKPDDLILSNMWYVEILDKEGNVVPFYDGYYGNFDTYVRNVNVPLDTIEFEKTNFGMLTVKDRDFPSSVSITFVDSVKELYFYKFKRWLNSIYDFDKNNLKNNWRKQAKDINVTQIQIENSVDIAKRVAKQIGNVGVGGLSLAESVASAFGYVDTSDVRIHKLMSYNLENCYISKLSDLEFDEGSGEPLEFDVDLECEKVTVKKLDYYKDILKY